MRYKEWGFLLVIACLGIMTANFVGFKVAFLDSLLLHWSCIKQDYPVKASNRGLLLDCGTLSGMSNLTDLFLCN